MNESFTDMKDKCHKLNLNENYFVYSKILKSGYTILLFLITITKKYKFFKSYNCLLIYTIKKLNKSLVMSNLFTQRQIFFL